jgi:hypothetical protein
VKVISKQSFGCFLLVAVLVFLCYAILVTVSKPTQSTKTGGDTNQPPLRIVVMDPLADQLACDCVEGYAQRKYSKLGTFLEKQLQRPVEIVYGENLADILKHNPVRIDLIIGKRSVVLTDTVETKTVIRPIAMLTDKNGSTDLTGLFVVRQGRPRSYQTSRVTAFCSVQNGMLRRAPLP